MKVFDHAAKMRGEAQSDRDVLEIMALLEQFHRTVFEAFVQDGIIHSDVHLGNMIYGSAIKRRVGEVPTTSCESNSDEASQDELGVAKEPRLVLFDVGQFERVSPPETLAILWTLVALSDNTRRRTLRDIAMKHLSECSTINPAFLKQSSDNTGEGETKAQELNDKWLRKTLCESFEAAIEPLSDGSVRPSFERIVHRCANQSKFNNCQNRFDDPVFCARLFPDSRQEIGLYAFPSRGRVSWRVSSKGLFCCGEND